MISKIDRNANKIFAKDLVASKEDSSLAALTGITNKFKGLNMATNVIKAAFVKSAKEQLNQVSLEEENRE